MPSRRYWVAEACGNELGKVMTKERIEQIVREKAELDLLSFLPGTRFRQERNFPIRTWTTLPDIFPTFFHHVVYETIHFGDIVFREHA